jgi:TRAP-type C4-dicarboxylate transport system substrate-binding protein
MLRALLLTAVAAAGLLTGCAGGGSEKSPAQATSVSLRAISDWDADPALDSFAADVTRRTGGRVRIEVVHLEQDLVHADAETRRFQAVADGTYDLGLLPTRSLEAGGERALAAFNAPLLVPSLEAERRILASPAPGRALAALSSVQGLAILPGALMRPLGTPGPLREPSDYRGALRFATASPTYAATATALGGRPMQLGQVEWRRQMVTGDIRGTAVDVTVYRGLGLAAVGPLTIDVVLFAKFRALVAAPGALDELTPADRAVLAASAKRIAAAEFANLPDENAAFRAMCASGARVVEAGALGTARLRTAVAPLWRTIAADPVAGPVLAALRQAVGSEPDSVAIDPGTCVREAGTTPAPAAGAAALPDGIYRQRIDLAEVTRLHPSWPQVELACTTGIFTLTLDGGRFEFEQRQLAECPGGPDPRGARIGGTYETSGTRATFATDEPNAFTGEPDVTTYTWAETAEGLDFTWAGEYDGGYGINGFAGLVSDDGYVNHWTRIG